MEEAVDVCLSSPHASEDSGPGVGKIHRGDVLKACELGDEPPSDPLPFEKVHIN